MKAIYIHIPFCVRKCLYCDFVSAPPKGAVFDFVAALKKEIETAGRACPDEETVTTVFFGGGTPTFLPAKTLADILNTVRANFPVAENAEISLECNPGTLSSAGARVLKEAGFNRVSVGLQSAENRLLKLIGRIHTKEEFVTAYAYLRKAGFGNINVDVMHGLPTQKESEYLDTLRFVCDLGPEHISSYALILEERTPLFGMVNRGELTLPEEDAVADMQDAGIRFLADRGYARYEISNFARPGYACRHNLVYWDNGAYLGFGPAAHSSYSIGGKQLRWHDTEDTEEYIADIVNGRSPKRDTEEIGEKEQRFESVMLGLRKVSGIDTALFQKRFGRSVQEAYPKTTAYLLKNGLLSPVTKDRYALTSRGLDLQNTVLLRFMEE